MKRILCLALCLVFASAFSVRAQSGAYREAVARLMEQSGSLKAVDTMIPQIMGYMKGSSPSVPEAVWEKMTLKFNEKLRDRMVDIYVPIYFRYLTLAELNELTALYETPLMQKVVSVTPAIMQEGMAAGAQIGQQIAAEIQQELTAEGYK